MQSFGVAFTGSGSATVSARLSNDDLSQLVETSDEWIAARTGIRQRHVAGSGESLKSLAVDAAKGAIATANLAPADIDLILLATSTPDDLFGTACQVQA
ncbi:MAG: 3-oxoacyl-ACP synthase, partial [Cyanobacteria bacterium J06628_6]